MYRAFSVVVFSRVYIIRFQWIVVGTTWFGGLIIHILCGIYVFLTIGFKSWGFIVLLELVMMYCCSFLLLSFETSLMLVCS